MRDLTDYSESEKRFYESIGLLIAKEVTAEKAAEISGYSFSTYLELLEKRKIYPYIYEREAYEMDLETIKTLTSK
jgi:predicted HTH domain antitoxin